MNRRQFLVLLAVLAALGAAGAGVMLSERSAWQSAQSRVGQKVIPALRIAEVAEIVVRDAAGEIHVVKRDGGWSVRERGDFAADTGRVGELLLKLAELKAVQEENLPEEQRARLQLVEPKDPAAQGAGTLLELKDANGTSLARLLLGRKIFRTAEVAALGRSTEIAAGRYLVAGDAKTMLAVSEPLAQAESKAGEWLVKDLLRVGRAKAVAATGGDGKPRWSIVRDGEAADWKFAGSRDKPDLQKATDIASALGWIDLVDVVADPAKSDTGLERAVTVKAETFDGLVYTVKIGNRSGDNYYLGVTAAGEKASERDKSLGRWTYLAGKGALEPLLRERAQLLPEKRKIRR